jgi:phosphatidylinositol alpha-1,6-mannosyltransferase
MSTDTLKKILFVSRPIAPPWDEASKNFAYHLSKRVAKTNPDLKIHLMTNGFLKSLPKNIAQENIYTSSEKDFKLSQKIRLLIYLIFNAHKFDIIHLFFTPTKFNSLFLKFILKNKKTKVIQTIATLREDIFSDAEIKDMIFGDMITTYSDYAKNKLNNLGIKNVQKIYPGIDLKDYYPREKSKKELQKHNFSEKDFIINFSGEYVRLDGMDDVVNSFLKVSKEIPEAKLSLAVRVKNEKDARKKEEIIKRLKENNLLEKVSFHDSGKFKMSDIYNLCDISLFTVRNMKGKFDIPLVSIEAMACGKPVVISDIPILQEFSNKNNSMQIESGNIEEITQAILTLYKDKEKRTYLGTFSRTYAKENFSINQSAEKYSEIYQNF